MFLKDSHCSYCGNPFRPGQGWPRTCARCGGVSYRNPIPVAVILVPAGGGVVLIRRGIEPRRGRWALPGGYVNLGETWQEAGAREVREEAGLAVDPAGIEVLRVSSPQDGSLLIFGVSRPVDPAGLPAFRPCQEASERMVATSPPADMAFELHRQALELHWARAGRQEGRQEGA